MTEPMSAVAAEAELFATCARMQLGEGDALYVLLREYRELKEAAVFRLAMLQPVYRRHQEAVSRLDRIADAHNQVAGDVGYCNECGLAHPCPTRIWATTERDPLSTWDPAERPGIPADDTSTPLAEHETDHA